MCNTAAHPGARMNFGFVIDNSSCIGCHACSTACKSENEVPLGVYRTWVKSVEAGQYPDVRRSFQVTRCNHCANPPCARICPTSAMFQRDDGIVEFDSDACIGCKACMQACPYDAIYLDPDNHTAAKCNFCAPRIDVGLEPACVVVCPEHAILAGDLDDPKSEVSRALGLSHATVRKPEQGTSPKLFYIQGNELTLHPDAGIRPESFAAADVRDHGHAGHRPAATPPNTRVNDRGMTLRTPRAQGLPAGGPITIGGRMAEQMVQVAYNAQHQVQWHWPIPAYLVTKHIAGGVFGLCALGALGLLPFDPRAVVFGGALGLVMLVVTLALLVYDLDRPDRFFFLLLRPQWKSWVARAAWILSGFAGVVFAWWGLEVAGWRGWLDADLVAMARVPLAVLTVPLAALTATYTAFLFAQAEGRDLWQGQHLPVLMAAQGVALGAAPLVALGAFDLIDPSVGIAARYLMLAALVLALGTQLVADLWITAPSELARRALESILRGPYRLWYWVGGVAVGQVLPIGLLLSGVAPLAALAVLPASLGLFAWAYAFVMAPQELPNS